MAVKCCDHSSTYMFYRISFILSCYKDIHNISNNMSSNFDQIRPLTAELSALECLTKTIFCVVATLASLFFSGSSSFLQVTRITIISRMSSNFGQIRTLTAELATLKCLKNLYFVLWPL